MASVSASTVLILTAPAHVSADSGLSHDGYNVTAQAEARRSSGTSGNRDRQTTQNDATTSANAGSPDQGSAHLSDGQTAARAAEISLRRQVADYQAALESWRACMTQTRQPIVSGDAAPFCTQPVPPDFATQLPGTLVTNAAAAVPGGPQIILTPEQIAYIAFARLHLEPLKPVIGPPPELNRWKMAAVGYPLWLSGGGDPHPPAVWDQVFNLRVRLEARVKSVDFLMGDGNVVTCDGHGLRWTPAVEPGEKSPVCGYQYAKPSLPDGNYTVTARTHWNVNWTINSQTGVIPMIQASSIELPVGELQVLVR